MISRRNLIKDLGLITLTFLLPTISYAQTQTTKAKAENLIKSFNKLLDNDFSMNLKRLLAENCFPSVNCIKCEVEYENNKKEQGIINRLFPELKELLKTDDSYSVNYLKSIEIGINIKNKKVTFILPKEAASINKKEIFTLENIIKNLFYYDSEKIFNDGKDADVNCVKGLESVKCYFTYEVLGKRGQFISSYTPKINEIEEYYPMILFEIKINKKHRKIEKRGEQVILTVAY